METKFQSLVEDLCQADPSSSLEISEEQLGHLMDMFFQAKWNSLKDDASREQPPLSTETEWDKKQTLKQLVDVIDHYSDGRDSDMRAVAQISYKNFSKGIEGIIECRRQFHQLESKFHSLWDPFQTSFSTLHLQTKQAKLKQRIADRLTDYNKLLDTSLSLVHQLEELNMLIEQPPHTWTKATERLQTVHRLIQSTSHDEQHVFGPLWRHMEDHLKERSIDEFQRWICSLQTIEPVILTCSHDVLLLRQKVDVSMLQDVLEVLRYMELCASTSTHYIEHRRLYLFEILHSTRNALAETMVDLKHRSTAEQEFKSLVTFFAIERVVFRESTSLSPSFENSIENLWTVAKDELHQTLMKTIAMATTDEHLASLLGLWQGCCKQLQVSQTGNAVQHDGDCYNARLVFFYFFRYWNYLQLIWGISKWPSFIIDVCF
jgi:hypothetical protein